MDLKKCTKCEQEKPATTEYFFKKKDGRDGLNSICKICAAQYCKNNAEKIKKRRALYNKENAEKMKAYRAQYYKDNAEKIINDKKQYYKDNLEKIKKYMLQYHKDNAEKLKEYNAQYDKDNAEKRKNYYKANLEKRKKHEAQYRKANLEKGRMKVHIRRARKKELPSTLTIDQWCSCKEYFNNKCAYCGKERKLCQEHFVALSQGGEYTINNIIPACGHCNNSKNNKKFSEWYPTYEFYSKLREKRILKYLQLCDGTQQLKLN